MKRRDDTEAVYDIIDSDIIKQNMPNVPIITKELAERRVDWRTELGVFLSNHTLPAIVHPVYIEDAPIYQVNIVLDWDAQCEIAGGDDLDTLIKWVETKFDVGLAIAEYTTEYTDRYGRWEYEAWSNRDDAVIFTITKEG